MQTQFKLRLWVLSDGEPQGFGQYILKNKGRTKICIFRKGRIKENHWGQVNIEEMVTFPLAL